ncbi:MAG: ribulose-phosphate 3-epimerase, partial [Gaiellaceae bacterium]
MARKLRIGAALFNGDHARLGAEIERIEAAGIDFVHMDVFDGRLVRGLAFSPRTLAALRPLSTLPFEVHLVADRPEEWLADLAGAGADLVLVHVEGATMLYETLFSVREAGMRTGIAVGLATPLDTIGAALPFVDAVL